jgi:hypothetical protein
LFPFIALCFFLFLHVSSVRWCNSSIFRTGSRALRPFLQPSALLCGTRSLSVFSSCMKLQGYNSSSRVRS